MESILKSLFGKTNDSTKQENPSSIIATMSDAKGSAGAGASATKQSGEEDVPEAFICPISQTLMEDPYVDSDGNSFEKMCILDWLSIKGVSPITRNPMTADSVFPNRALKSMIEDWKKQTGITSFQRQGTNNVLLGNAEAAPKEDLGRKPLLLFALIDNSGSMCSQCGNNASGENDGYNRLDLVKHTLNTIITSLTDQDKICVIKFNTVADIVVPVTALTEDNKSRLISRVATLEPEGMTNIWDALRLAVDQASKWTDSDYNIDIYLLTDGEPTVNPPRDIVDTLTDFIETKNFAKMPQINTFGYGYDLDSNLLYKLSQVSSGSFGFIPDSTMVGTVFINALSNSMVRADEDEFSATHHEITNKTVDMLTELLETKSADKLTEFIEYAHRRSDELRTIADSPSAAESVQFLQDIVLDCKESSDPNIGQLHKAIQPSFFDKWGMHYILSVRSAFKRRNCINFKDKGMQHFKNNHFIKEQKRVERVFVSLPPPKPSGGGASRGPAYRSRAPIGSTISGGGGRAGGVGSSAPGSARARSMASYYDASGGCFTPTSLVYIRSSESESWSTMPIGELCSGMTVMTDRGPSTVECVVKLRYSGDIHHVGQCVGLTPYHPVLLTGGAYFPIEVGTNGASSSRLEGYVYDVVLTNRGIIACPYTTVAAAASCASGIIDFPATFFAATFGHTCKMEKFAHHYFGSERVVDDLKQHPDYASGSMVLENYQYLRFGINDHDRANAAVESMFAANQVYKLVFAL